MALEKHVPSHIRRALDNDQEASGKSTSGVRRLLVGTLIVAVATAGVIWVTDLPISPVAPPF